MQNNRGEELSKEALFDSMGHPMRVKILEAVNGAPLSFSEIKRNVGIDSSGHLTFHLDKLKGLLKVNADGNYELTDDGKEALRLVSVFSTMRKERPEAPKKDWKKNCNIVWACALIVVVVISAATIYAACNTALVIRNDQGKYYAWGQFWMNVDDARSNIHEAMNAVNANDFCAARYELAVAEVYLDLVVFQSYGIIALGEDYSKLYNEGLHNIYLLKPTLSRIGESMTNGSVSDGQMAFLGNLASVLYYLLDSMKHEDDMPYTIADINGNLNRLKVLANTTC
jgi:DNA-binding transcriptional ArsR family regulator